MTADPNGRQEPLRPGRNEAAERLRLLIREDLSAPVMQEMLRLLDAALAAEREPLLAALRALVRDYGESPYVDLTEARALIEQDGRLP